ncbi:hypothetical protein RMSM_06207 [Rhodopirellula maiorica SM1]|uniref:Uncharacterized protein n=1 Tax=Rhodopirellula maiorica SM1 TaxID=1265738 RepID=M5RCT4_9BACT|nr:hypothetical protein RMSM_06207 [Rhodopirellula maiorica SM1]
MPAFAEDANHSIFVSVVSEVDLIGWTPFLDALNRQRSQQVRKS